MESRRAERLKHRETGVRGVFHCFIRRQGGAKAVPD
ncbi:protein of unknown function (plasmid) [Azospirillum lipoferum 4B]|uniref:Uncharacterized protein n=1 Tax=Azospirillum lipoferum (strain 4B) TaxID=862719 RepID=G7ZGV6_AZOL4|nr:protein of unknown function [Azospirillum lipoferum 4B]